VAGNPFARIREQSPVKLDFTQTSNNQRLAFAQQRMKLFLVARLDI
jgi:hypothetical protein